MPPKFPGNPLSVCTALWPRRDFHAQAYSRFSAAAERSDADGSLMDGLFRDSITLLSLPCLRFTTRVTRMSRKAQYRRSPTLPDEIRTRWVAS